MVRIVTSTSLFQFMTTHARAAVRVAADGGPRGRSSLFSIIMKHVYRIEAAIGVDS